MPIHFDPQVDEILDHVDDSLDAGTFPVSVLTDKGLFDRELERIFTRAWVYVGHESEITSRGDYVHRYIGKDAFVLVRGEDDQVRVLFDSCRHRGALICRAEKGNASHFRCSYHGWTYANTGEMTGAPMFRKAYGSMDKSKWGLIQAAHVENLHGFIFASLDPEAPTLEEYLGEMKWYFDLVYGQLKDGWEVIGEPMRSIVHANWKTASENFGGDDYHTMFLHKSLTEVNLTAFYMDDTRAPLSVMHVLAGNGHSIALDVRPEDDGKGFWMWPNGEELYTDALGEELYDTARRTASHVGTIFPNFSILGFPLQQTVESGPVAMHVIRVWLPRSPTELELINWVLVPKGLTEEQKTEAARSALATFGTSGTFEQDDTEPWEAVARTSETAFAKKIDMQLNYQLGMPQNGTAISRQGDEILSGPGIKYFPAFEEGLLRGFWRRWVQFMRPGDYPTTMTPAEQDGERG
ncbi:aromatic ring-hydroxylating oxygenase subunit alpha [Microbacterium gorillae]|uniref:aromatic ring-hydroxylating oxygenase subunit alpha n=1 Tax=Microbacterium gorillae TaxID=1231063 RepID=UPI0006945740|nr:Rieske 2Fe-2S domain-containing protein [Microbacterium gorillae]